MPRIDNRRVAGLLLTVLAVATLVSWWTSPDASELFSPPSSVFVTSPADHGPGSLREAIFAAARLDQPVTIEVKTPRLEITNELPPLFNRHGLRLIGDGTIVDASQSVGTSALHLASDHTVVKGVTIRRARAAAFLVTGSSVQLQNVTLEECVDGVSIAGSNGVAIAGSRFLKNATGVRIGDDAHSIVIADNHFEGHAEDAIRAVAPRPASRGGTALVVRANEFADDRISVLALNMRSRIEGNTFERARDTAIVIMGDGNVVARNNLRHGYRLGILADGARDSVIEDNEVNHHAAVAIMAKGGDGTVLQNNRLYENAYGIAVVLGDRQGMNLVRRNLLLAQTVDSLYFVGTSPLVSENRVLRSHAAALRALDVVPRQGAPRLSRPQLSANVFDGNSIDTPVYGRYHEIDAGGSR